MKIGIILTLVATFLFTGFEHSHAQTGPATDSVRHMLDEAISIQTDAGLQGQQFRDVRRGAVKKLIIKNFCFDEMARQVLDRSCEGVSSSMKSEFKSLFQDLFLESYTRLVLDFLKNEEVLYNGEDGQESTTLVRTTIHRTNEQIPVDYSVMRVEEKWLVRDVRIDGVSIVENYRNAFSRLIKQQSFEGLLQKMRVQQKAIQK
jgi:phospholipid transport system substrate-binding protein